MVRLSRTQMTPLAVALAIAALGAACGAPPEQIPVMPKLTPTAEPDPAPAPVEEAEPRPTPAPKPAPRPTSSARTPTSAPWPTFERPATPPAMTPDGSVANVDTVINGMGSDLKRCYDRELLENGAAKGSVRLRVHIEPAGDVNSVQLLSQTGNLSAALLRCVAKVVGSRWFLPGGSGASLELPLTLAPDKPGGGAAP